jgi:GGDEF domain-containing protein
VPSIAADATGRNRPARAESDPVDRAIATRALLAERLEYEMVRHARHERPLALFAVEVDRAEAVADAAAALRRALRAQDTVAHVGGRGLCVLAPETDRYAASHLSRRVREAVAGAGVGVALFPHDARSARELVARAAAGARAHAAERRAA